MEQRAQGAIEYLLIIGAAILVVAIVIIAVTGVLGGAKTSAGATSSDVNIALCKSDCNALGQCTANTGCNIAASGSCAISGTTTFCKPVAGGS